VNVMTERTWEAIGRPAMIPSLSGIGLFRGKLVNLCGRLTQISMNANGTSTEEDFEIIKFIEDNALFTMLLGNPWIERTQARKKEEEKVLEQQRQELKDFMTRKIVQLIEEQENRSKTYHTGNPDFKVLRVPEDSQKTEASISEKEEMLYLNPKREPQQHEVTRPEENRNQNGKRTTETKLTGKKARKLSKKRVKIEKLQEIPGGTLQKENHRN
jgi:hypothetical protein